jgi:hypothetical protein
MNNFHRKIIFFIFPIIVLLVLSSIVHAQVIDISEVNKKINSIVHYAEEYEVGNINYLQLNVYGHKIRADLNLMLGGSIGEEWARIPKENIEKTFGQPTQYTNWIWRDDKHLHNRLDEAMPQWERIIFDGRKVRIIFNSFPSAIEDKNGELFKYYSVDLMVKFKKEYDIDIDAIFSDITSLAADFNLTRTTKSGETLVTRMLEYERTINSYVEENMESCTEIIDNFFEPEEKWPEQGMLVWRLNLYEGKDFDLILQLEECNDCGEGKWIYMWVDVKGIEPMFIFSSPELNLGKLAQQIDEEYYRTLSIDELNQELKNTFFEMRDEAEKFDKTRSEDFPKKLFFNRFKMQEISRIQDEKYNNVYEFDEGIARRIASGELQGPGGCKDLDTCRMYCEKNTEECVNFMHNLRVEFLDNIFKDYEIEKTPIKRINWERILIENSVTRQDSLCMHVNDLQCSDDEGCANGTCVPALGGNETCDNEVDDDGDNIIDCQDPDCWQERQCGKLCEDICNREGGCWQTIHEVCYDLCKECWDCGESEECKNICEPACWPCHDKDEIKNACDDCWVCEDEAYGGCYVECKSCEECNNQRREKIRAIFDRAATGEIETPGGCMSEDDCNKYCAEHGEECGEIMTEIGFYSEELDCSEECKECTICNHDLGNFECNENQYFDRNNGYCICNEGWYDCDGNQENGCESEVYCDAGPCFEECKECDTCEEECDELCLECYKCRNPDMPTYICDGVERLEPCEIEYVCNGVKQKKPCKTYICNGREYTEPCDEINITCGLNQILVENKCICKEGFKDCDNDGDCESTKACGLEICDDNKDNNNNGFIDCQDKKCDQQVCRIENGKELFCIEKRCVDPEEIVHEEPEPICGNHVCEEAENEELCPEDCIVCEIYEPPECPNGKIVWKGKDENGCRLPPICVVTQKECEVDKDCPQPTCAVSQCIDGECKVTELLTDCKEVCEEGRTKTRKCKDGTEIVTAICSANEWVKTGYDCPEAPKKCEEGETQTKSCEDGSEIVIKQCVDGEWVKTDEKCPEIPEEEPTECLPIPISMWCPDGKTLCPMKTDENGCNVWNCDACAKIVEEGGCSVDSDCRWCGSSCVLYQPKLVCTMEAAPEGYDCVCENNVCTKIYNPPAEEVVTPETPEEEVPEELPIEEVTEEVEEEIAPEVEEETLEVCEDCVLATDCGGPQDVCSNGNCVTLPLPVEGVTSETTPPLEEAPVEPPIPVEQPAEQPSPEIPSESPEATPEQITPTGSFIEVLSKLITSGFTKLTGLFIGEEQPCENQCKTCEDCNRKVDDLMKKIQSGEIQGPGDCKNRKECEEYCSRMEHLDECGTFLKEQNLETIDCWWEFCRDCDICRYDIGEFQCNENQQFNRDEGYCECIEGFYDCDGDWENGCESQIKCGACESKEDCAQDSCAPSGNVVQQFDCIKGEEWIEERGVFMAQGACHLIPNNVLGSWGGVYFEMGGEPFEELRPLREEISLEMGEQWCEWELDNLIKERVELQNSITTDFLKWFFEEYVPSSPSEWEKHIGGIYDSYWRFVNNNERTTEMLLCLGRDKLPEEYKPIDISYDTEYGSVRIWETETTTDFYGKRAKIISTYMQIWIFPTKDFIKKEFQNSMESGLMPGPEGNKKPELSPSEIEEIKKDKKLMDLINSLSNKYGGEAKFLLTIVDGEEVVFNALITINPDTLFKFEPMKEYEGDYDVKMIVDFDFFYDLILTTEKDIRGGDIVYPPWETGVKLRDMFKGAVDGIKMWYMINSAVNAGDIKAEPPEDLSDGLEILRIMFERGPQE